MVWMDVLLQVVQSVNVILCRSGMREQRKTPDGKNGTTDASGTYDGYEQLELLGRGLAKIRPTNYAQYELWKNCGDDMRHNQITGSISHVSTTIFRHLKEAAVNILVNQLILLTVPILCVAISLSQL